MSVFKLIWPKVTVNDYNNYRGNFHRQDLCLNLLIEAATTLGKSKC